MEGSDQLDIKKKQWEVKKLIKENRLLVITMLAALLSIFDSFNVRALRIPDLSKSNNLTPPHIVEKISFKAKKTTTAVKFWYAPTEDKNQGIQMTIMESQYVIIKSTHDNKISILDSKGNFIPLVSLYDLNWVFQTPKTDEYMIVIGGKTKAEITIDIPPITKKENIMVLE